MKEVPISIQQFGEGLHAWQSGNYLNGDLTPQARFNRVSGEEVGELHGAIEMNDPKEILGESVDCIIGFFGVALTVAEPVEVAAALLDKLTIMYQKYDPARMVELRDAGFTTEEALAFMKKEWEIAGKDPSAVSLQADSEIEAWSNFLEGGVQNG